MDSAGSIPAWAGEPPSREPCARINEVYPRVGGGTGYPNPNEHSPDGLSPRGRGNRSPMGLLSRSYGSIPAWAGEPQSASQYPHNREVYPRVGGGTGTVAPSWASVFGLSPRGRGNLMTDFGGSLKVGSIPAWAGEPCVNPGGSF